MHKTVAQVLEVLTPVKDNSINEIEKYREKLKETTGLGPNQNIDLTDRTMLKKFLIGVIMHENSNYGYPDELIEKALDLALK